MELLTGKGMAALAIALLILSTPLHAEIYKWTDENGKVHFSDKVPVKERDKAESVNVSIKNLSDQEVEDAKLRAAKIHQAAQVTAAGNKSREPKRKAKSTSRHSGGTIWNQPKGPKAPGSYSAAMKRYKDSQACYSMVKNSGGNQTAAVLECGNVARPRESDY